MAESMSENAREAMNRVIGKLRDGDIGPIIEVIKLRRTKNDTPFGNWSLSNQLLALMQSGEVDCRGFRQWQEVGRMVKKGEKAVYILGPMIGKITDKATGEERVFVKGFRTIPVFALSQTEGKDLEVEVHEPQEMPPLIDVARRLNINVMYQPTGNADGWFSKGKIVLGTHNWGVFFHELAHAAHNEIERLKGGQNKEQEIVAEFTAAVLMALYGIDFTGNAWQYIKSYAPTDALTAVVKCMSTIEKVLDLICGEADAEKVQEKEEGYVTA